VGRILAVDYGKKRTGIAVTDPLRLIANGLTTVPTKEILLFLTNYFNKEKVDIVIVGYPKQMNNTPSEIVPEIEKFVTKMKEKFPALSIEYYDERFTSKMAFQTMIDGGLKQKARQDKALIDTISATILLQSWMEFNSQKKF